MICWKPRPEALLAAAATLALAFGTAGPAQALPLINLGADAGVAVHLATGGPALDLDGDLNFFGAQIAARVWDQVPTSTLYAQGLLGMNVSPVPGLGLVPAIGVGLDGGSVGPLVNLTGSFSPYLLPLSVEASAGAGYFAGSTLLPYSVGIKVGIFPLTSLALRYRGWAGGAPLGGVSGPELGVVVGL